jgi:hypothetical protein
VISELFGVKESYHNVDIFLYGDNFQKIASSLLAGGLWSVSLNGHIGNKKRGKNVKAKKRRQEEEM